MHYLFRRPSTSGMTLLEVITVMAILGILAAIAAPGWLTFANRQRANRATDQILQSIRTSQADAKRTRRTRTLQFDRLEDTPTVIINGNSFKIGEGDLDGMVTLKVFEDVILDGDGNAIAGTDITAQVESGGTKSIDFNSTGGIDSSKIGLPLHITVAVPDEDGVEKCVEIRSLLGATRTLKDAECAF